MIVHNCDGIHIKGLLLNLQIPLIITTTAYNSLILNSDTRKFYLTQSISSTLSWVIGFESLTKRLRSSRR